MSIMSIFRSILGSIILLLTISIQSSASAIIEEGYKVTDPTKKFLSLLNRPELTLDHLNSQGYEIYGPHGLGEFLKKAGVTFAPEARKNTRDYESPELFAEKLKVLVAKYPKFAKIFSIGKSVKGRDLWFVKVSTDVLQEKGKPEFKYISTMHGDEITGRELMYSLIEDLLKNYGTDATITALLDSTSIYIMPNMNPDGTSQQQRANANSVDLNRDFPDFNTPDNQNTLGNRAIETQNIMKFEASRNFSLSANFHGGAEVVNYPWDAIPQHFPFYNLVVNMSLDYAKRVPYISQSSEFKNGITNGYEWYLVNGGMQDWSYHYHNDLQLTIELSNTKWPDSSQMAAYYQENRSALLNMISMIHQGAGFTFDDTNVEGSVNITTLNGADLGTYDFNHSTFYKVLEPGKYQFNISTNKGLQKSQTVEVSPYIPVSQNRFVKIKL